jgi:hypothetical protein
VANLGKVIEGKRVPSEALLSNIANVHRGNDHSAPTGSEGGRESAT